jgi:hypothetical protein
MYPIGSINHDETSKLLVLYQKNSHLELSYYHPETHETTKALLSAFMPAGSEIVPGGEGFSFIDNDRIRIKMVNKRSPRTLDLYGPYDINQIKWIDKSNFYFGAKERSHFALFHGTTNDDLYQLTPKTKHDYLFPQKIDTHLFFIEQFNDGSSSFSKASYPEIPLPPQKIDLVESLRLLSKGLFEEEHEPLLTEESIQQLIKFDIDTNIAFLKMVSPTQGFYIQHPEEIDYGTSEIIFEYHSVVNNDDRWITKKLFNFTVSSELLIEQPRTGISRLYESLLPLLPVHDKDLIYFVSVTPETGALDLYSYEDGPQAINQLTHGNSPEELCFCPFRHSDGYLYCGGTVQAPESNLLPKIYIELDNSQHYSLLRL